MATCSECGKPVKAKGLCSGHYNRAYYAANTTRLRAAARQWHHSNPEKAQAKNAARNPARLRELARNHYYRNRLAHLAKRANQRARQLGIPGVLSAAAIEARFAYFGNRCWLCGTHGDITVDHVKPLGKRGLNWPANIRPACPHCNFARTWKGRR